MMSTGDRVQVDPGVPAAHPDSLGPRGSIPSPGALSLSAKVTPWPPAPHPEADLHARPESRRQGRSQSG